MSKVTKQVDLIVKGYADMSGMASIPTSLSAMAERANTQLSESIVDFKGAGTEAAGQLIRVAQVAYIELRRIARSEDVKIAVSIAKEKAESGLRSLMALASKLSSKSGVTLHVGIPIDAVKSKLENLEIFHRAIIRRISLAGDQVKSKIENAAVLARMGARKIDSALFGRQLTVKTGDNPFKNLLDSFDAKFPAARRVVRISLMAKDGISRVAGEAYNALGPLRRLAQRGIVVAVRATLAGGANVISRTVGGISGAIGKLGAIATSAFGIITGGLAAMGVAVGAISLVRLLAHTSQQMDATAKLSDRLGIATEKFTAYQYAAKSAGVGAGEFENALEQMLRRTAEAAGGSDALGMSFDRIGLDARELANLPTDQAFSKIADGLSKVENASERGALAMDLFGRGGQSMLPMLMKGADGLKAAEAEAKRLGITFSRMDAAKVEMANDAMGRLGAVGKGALQTLVVQLSPFVESFTQKLVNMAASGEGVGARVVGAFGWILKAAGKVADYLELLNAGWQTMRGVVSYALGSVLAALAPVIRGVEWLANKLTGEESTGFGDAFTMLAEEVLVEGDKAFAKANESWGKFLSGENSKKAANFIIEIQDKANQAAQSLAQNAEKNQGKAFIGQEALKLTAERAEKISEIINRLNTESAEAGLSDMDRQIRELEQLGATANQLAEARAAIVTKQSADEMKALADEAKQLKESVRTPAEKTNAEIDKIRTMFSRGLIDSETVKRSVEAAYKDLNPEVAQSVEVRLPELLGNEFNALAQAQREQGMTVDPLIAVNEQMLATQREILNATIIRSETGLAQAPVTADMIKGRTTPQSFGQNKADTSDQSGSILNTLKQMLSVLKIKQEMIPIVKEA